MPSTPPPLISVIVPVYNVEDHVAACIASLRGQSLDDFEAIVVDDGATDASRQRAEAAMAGDPRFRLISQPNAGLSAARNAGLSRARGEFIAFLDSDDRFAPDFLLRMHAALAESGADWVACALRFQHPDGTGSLHSALHGIALRPGGARLYPLHDWRAVIRHFPSAWNKLYRRDLIGDLRFDEGTYFEDHAFFYQLAARTTALLHLPEPLYLQTRGRPGQITAEDSDRVFEQLAVLDRITPMLHDPVKSHGAEAFEQIASRLLFERSVSLRDGARRGRYLQAARQFLADRGLTYRPEWDETLPQAFGLELAGQVPLSVVIPWNGNPVPLRRSLAQLASETVGVEVLLVCDRVPEARGAAVLAEFPGLPARCLSSPGRGEGAARNAGFAQAQGLFVLFLDAGDCPAPEGLRDWLERMLRHEADFGLSQFRLGLGQAGVHNGFHDMRGIDPAQLGAGPLALNPDQAMALHAHPSAKIFRRAFLEQSGLRFGTGALGSWRMTIGAALRARRIAYCDWPAVAIGLEPGARRVLARPVAPGRMAAALAEIARSFPETAQAAPGWQRRLMARALWEQASFAHTSGKARQWLALRAIPVLMRLPGPAGGFDPYIPSRIRALCTLSGPADLAGIAFRPPLPDNRPAELSHAIDRSSMLTFPVTRFGLFACRLRFQAQPYANFSFYDRDNREILFHLSLRAEDGLAVCNARSAEENGWGREIRRPVTLDRAAPVHLEIEFAPPRVQVRLNGAQIFRFGAGWRPGRFRNLGRIGFVDIQADLPPAAIDMAVPLDPGATPATPLWLSHRLELRTERPEAGLLRLTVSDSDAAGLPVPVQSGSGWRAILPGRIWCDLPETVPLEIALHNGAGPLTRLSLSRADLARQISARLAGSDLRTDMLAATQILEHVRFAGLWPLLEAPARTAVGALAARLGLEAFLWPESEGPAAADPARPVDATSPAASDALMSGSERRARRISAALGDFAMATRRDPGRDPALFLPDLGLNDDELAEACVALSEAFSLADRAEALLEFAQERGLPPFCPKGEGWHDSAIAPFLLRQGDFEALRDLFWQLADDRQSWLVTPAIGWVLRRALRDEAVDHETRNALIYAFLALLDKHLPDYWGRTPCESLIRAALALIGAGPMLPDYLRRQTEETVLRSYGLSEVFWAQFPTVADQAGPGLRLAQVAFADLRAKAFGPAPTPRQIAAIRVLERAGVSGVARLRREVLGPAGFRPDPSQPFAAQALAEGLDPAEAGLRAMAFPGAPPPDAELCDILREAMPARVFPALPHAPFARLQSELGHRLPSLLAKAAAGTPPSVAELAQVLTELARLSEGNSFHLGIGLAIRLADALARRGADAAAQNCLTWLAGRVEWAGAEGRDDAALFEAAAVVGALSRAQSGPLDSDLAALFPTAQAMAAPLPAPAETSPIFDTLVVVFSCRPNLETRIPAMRAGWLAGLKALGVPYLVIVGGADAPRQDGDVLHLPCPDDYEGLPQKTLAVVDWVRRNTGFGHLLKIDDDCFLNAPEYFSTLSHLKFDYYGRKLTRGAGQMDRAWHNAKSTTARGRLELDKSAEPSSYCDGGSGYALSRRAMEAVARASVSPEGQALIQSSFMEDKLLGDLLALEGIAPQNEDYRITVRRRENPKGIPVPRWVNGFDASACAPMKLVHLDCSTEQGPAQARLNTSVLWPKKIWPGYQGAWLHEDCNALELISPPARLAQARDAEVAVVACMRNEMFALPQFLAHYRGLGVGAFLIADNCSDDGTLEYLADQPDVAVFSVDTAYALSRYGVAWQQALLGAFRVGKWSLVADADELLVWRADGTGNLPALLREADFAEAEAVRVFMLDMYPQGSLSKVTFAGSPFAEAGFVDREPFLQSSFARGPFSNAATWTSAVRHRLIPGSRRELFVAQKLALLKYHPLMRLSAGLHYGAEMRVAERELLFGHFKYNADFRRKALAETARRQHFNGAEEYRKYLALVAEGRDVIYENGLSLPWTDAEFVRHRLDGAALRPETTPQSADES